MGEKTLKNIIEACCADAYAELTALPVDGAAEAQMKAVVFRLEAELVMRLTDAGYGKEAADDGNAG